MIIHLAEPCSTALLKENIDSKHINVGYQQRHVSRCPELGLQLVLYAVLQCHGVSRIN